MELLLILIYVSICYAVFKIFRIPVNQWSLATSALGGIIGIALLLLIMNYNHPFTSNARIYFAVTPVLPSVRGRVIDVPAPANAPLKEGDVLFRIDPAPYQFVVDQKKAALAEAEQNVKQLKAGLDQATRHRGAHLAEADESDFHDVVPSSRHCERSEAIHSFFVRRHGLLRCARNDGLTMRFRSHPGSAQGLVVGRLVHDVSLRVFTISGRRYGVAAPQSRLRVMRISRCGLAPQTGASLQPLC